MPYIGHEPTNAGNFYILDDFNGLGQDGSSSTYDQNANGTIVNYKLMVAGVAITPNVDNLFVTIDGVVQHPTDAYSISGSILTFTEAPASGVDFHCFIMGQSATVGEGSIGADELKVSGDGTSGQLLKSDGDGTMSWINQNTVTASTANVATHVTVADNESTNENNLLTFVEDASGAGNVGLESDGDLHYNPSTGRLTATQLAGTLQTAAQTNITSVGTLTGLTIENATNPLVVGDGTKDLYFDPDSNGVMVSTATSQGGDGHYYNDASGEVWTTIDGTAKVKVKASAFEVTPAATFAGALTVGGHITYSQSSGNSIDLKGDRTDAQTTLMGGSSGAGVQLFGSTFTNYAGSLFLDATASSTGTVDAMIIMRTGSSPTEALRLDRSQNATFAGDIKNSSDSKALYVGASDDLKIHHNGTDSYIQGTEGHLFIHNNKASKDLILLQEGASGGIEFRTNNSVVGRWNSSGKLRIGATESDAMLRVRQDSSQTAPGTNDGTCLYLTGYNADSKYGGGIGWNWNDCGTGVHPAVWIGTQAKSYASYTKADLIFTTRDVVTNDAGSERMRIATDGLVTIGTSGFGSAGTTLKQLGLAWSTSTYWDTTSTGTFTGMAISNPHADAGTGAGIQFSHGASSSGISYIVSRSERATGSGGDRSSLHFGTRGSDGIARRMHIGDDGTVNINANSNNLASLNVIASGSGSCPNDAKIYASKNNASDWTFKADAGADDYGYTTNGAGSYAYYVTNHSASGAATFRVEYDGDILAANTSIASISDRRLKKEITNASSQWDDIKALNFVNYKWKKSTGMDDSIKYLGLVADEVESVSPGLIKIDAQPKEDIEAGVEDPEYKTVKYSIVWMKAVKALQEAMAKIETLEAKVEALENA